MEVNRSNFFEKLPEVERSIAECDFLALDLEMTGLTSGKMERQKPWDSAQQRYTKVRDGAVVICPTQFGLCTFKFNQETQSYAEKTAFLYRAFVPRFLQLSFHPYSNPTASALLVSLSKI